MTDTEAKLRTTLRREVARRKIVLDEAVFDHPLWDLLGPSSRQVYIGFIRLRNRFTKWDANGGSVDSILESQGGQEFYISAPKLAKASWCSLRTAGRSARLFDQIGIIDKTSRGRSNSIDSASGWANSFKVPNLTIDDLDKAFHRWEQLNKEEKNRWTPGWAERLSSFEEQTGILYNPDNGSDDKEESIRQNLPNERVEERRGRKKPSGRNGRVPTQKLPTASAKSASQSIQRTNRETISKEKNYKAFSAKASSGTSGAVRGQKASTSTPADQTNGDWPKWMLAHPKIAPCVDCVLPAYEGVLDSPLDAEPWVSDSRILSRPPLRHYDCAGVCEAPVCAACGLPVDTDNRDSPFHGFLGPDHGDPWWHHGCHAESLESAEQPVEAGVPF